MTNAEAMTGGEVGLQRRRTWVIGGVVLVMAALAGLIMRGSFGGFSYAKDALWALGALVLVIGFGRAGSVTGRRPVTTALVILQIVVANPLAAMLVSGLIAKDPGNPQAEENAWKAVFFPYQVIVVVLTVLAVVLIGTARAMPSPWNWAPAWVLAWSWGIGWASLGLFSAAPLGAPIATISAWAGLLAGALGTAFLGVVAIALGRRATRVPARL